MLLNSYQDIVSMTPDYKRVNEDRERYRNALVGKWTRTNLLRKLSPEVRRNMAIMLENEAIHLRKLNETTAVSDIAAFNKIAFPLVRRTFGRLLANEIISVQPMNLPSGLLFYLDFVFERTKGGALSGTSLYGDRSAVYNKKLQGIGAQTATYGYYDLNSGYSKRNFVVSNIPTFPTQTALTSTSVNVTGTLTGFNFTIATTASTDMSQTRVFKPVKNSEIVLDGQTYRSLNAVQNLTADSYRGNYDPGLTQLVDANTIRIFANVNLASTAVSTATLIGAASNFVDDLNYPGTYTAEFEAVSQIPQINIQIKSVPVLSVERKLKTVWTTELAQDIMAYHSIDPDIELTRVMSESIAVEIDNEILSDLIAAADVKAVWSRKNGRFLKLNSDGTITVQTYSNVSNSTYQANFASQREWYDTLIETINTVSNEVYKRNLRSGVNWIVCSPEIASIIESMSMFQSEIIETPNGVNYSLGIVKMGSLQNRYTVYKNPYFPADKMLLGFKGDSFLETGYVYAPYIPLLVTPTIFEPENFTPRKMVLTRYANQVVRPEYYAVITIFDLDFIGNAV